MDAAMLLNFIPSTYFIPALWFYILFKEKKLKIKKRDQRLSYKDQMFRKKIFGHVIPDEIDSVGRIVNGAAEKNS
jgi:hypothetical protein